MFTLCTTPRSLNGRKVLALCHHLALQPNVELCNLYEGHSDWDRSLSPHDRYPMLIDGDLTLSEPNAMLQYIAETHGDFALTSRDAHRRAEIARS